MLCGTGSFSHVDDGDDHPLAPSTPKGSRKKHNKNPYSTRGLDKFSTVLAELEDRREKIMAQAGSQGVAMVRFMYTNSQDWIPIIVRPKPEEPKAATASAKQQPPSSPRRETKQAAEEAAKEESTEKKEVKKSLSWNMRERCRRFNYYWALAMVLILVCLVLFGRVFAICCTSIWWYLVPMMVDRSGNNGNGRRRKELGRRMSDKRLGGNGLAVSASSQPRKMGGGLQELASPRAQGNGQRG